MYEYAAILGPRVVSPLIFWETRSKADFLIFLIFIFIIILFICLFVFSIYFSVMLSVMDMMGAWCGVVWCGVCIYAYIMGEMCML
jgi:hypothetical protein